MRRGRTGVRQICRNKFERCLQRPRRGEYQDDTSNAGLSLYNPARTAEQKK